MLFTEPVIAVASLGTYFTAPKPILLLILLAAIVFLIVILQQMLPSGRKCVPLTIPMCMDLPYNMTVYPNLLNHQTQADAEIAINQFNPLVKVKCSEDIKLFLCTV